MFMGECLLVHWHGCAHTHTCAHRACFNMLFKVYTAHYNIFVSKAPLVVMMIINFNCFIPSFRLVVVRVVLLLQHQNLAVVKVVTNRVVNPVVLSQWQEV